MKAEKDNSVNILTLVGYIIMILAIIWIGKKIYHRFFDNNGEKEPFWENTEFMKVCKVPYYSSNECYKLNVRLIDEKNAQIYFSNGGTLVTSDLTCFEAAGLLPDQKEYDFCRSWDFNTGNQWDFMPIWAYLPSGDDLLKVIDAEFGR